MPTPPIPRPLPRRSVLGLLLLLLALLGLAAWVTLDQARTRHALDQGRAVADFAEHVGRWASQYGGVHVRTQGADAPLPGSYLTRSSFDAEAAEAAGLPREGAERAQMARLQNYYWKNPALVQREVADLATSAGSRITWRMTARTVLNPANQPKAFELEALDQLQQRGPAPAPAAASPAAPEYWRVDGRHLMYARAIRAEASCLKCHDRAETAPAFLRANAAFNGGGGFGYQVGQAVGVISVSVPLDAGGGGPGEPALPPTAWVALAGAALCLLALLAGLLRTPKMGR